MVLDDFLQWLDRYGRAWVEGDPDAAARLFSDTAAYHEVPFEAPMRCTEFREWWHRKET